MASRQVLLLAVVIAAAAAIAFLPGMTSAVEYMVGDAGGWTLNYPATWPDDKIFRVGDSLMFMYPQGKHTVYEVDGPTFKSCNTTSNPIKSWTTGSDTVSLGKTGRRWFFCSVADHCSKGLKLVVNVADASAGPAPAPSAAVSLRGAAGGVVAASGAAVAAAVLLL